eukprot:SAG31_NODE_178_length_21247_cov_11.492009_17_plen_109_part_00
MSECASLAALLPLVPPRSIAPLRICRPAQSSFLGHIRYSTNHLRTGVGRLISLDHLDSLLSEIDYVVDRIDGCVQAGRPIIYKFTMKRIEVDSPRRRHWTRAEDGTFE